jgi:hypothetical protein
MAQVIDLSVLDNAQLVDSFAKATEAKKRAEAVYDAHKDQFAARGMLVHEATVYGNKFTVKFNESYAVRFSASACEAKMGANWMLQFKKRDEKPTWRMTPKAITVLTDETADKVAAL